MGDGVVTYQGRPRGGAIVALATIAAASFACGRPAHWGTQPEDLSAAEHRRRAAEHEGRADGHHGQVDPSAAVSNPRAFSFPVVPNINAESTDVAEIAPNPPASYNPTTTHGDDAREELTHARDHLRAAMALEAFADEACRGVPQEARDESPLLGRVRAVEPLDEGVRLTFVAGVDMDALMAAVRCHQAAARERGYGGAPHCPLYLKGVDVIPEPSAAAVRLLTSDEATAKALQRRSRHLSGDIEQP